MIFQVTPDTCSYSFTWCSCRFPTIRFYAFFFFLQWIYIDLIWIWKKHNCGQMQNGPSSWKLEAPSWVALGRMSHCEEVVLVLTLATSRRASVKSILKGEQQIMLFNKDKKKNHLSSLNSKFLFNHFSHFALPPTQLHGSSHNFIQMVAVSFNKSAFILLYKFKLFISISYRQKIISHVCFTFYPLVT